MSNDEEKCTVVGTSFEKILQNFENNKNYIFVPTFIYFYSFIVRNLMKHMAWTIVVQNGHTIHLNLPPNIWYAPFVAKLRFVSKFPHRPCF